MKATRKTIPGLIGRREEFKNHSGTLRAIKHPTREAVRRMIVASQLDEDEAVTLQAHSELNRIVYMIVSYETPIAWEVASGYVYKVSQELTQTTEQHKLLLTEFEGRETE